MTDEMTPEKGGESSPRVESSSWLLVKTILLAIGGVIVILVIQWLTT